MPEQEKSVFSMRDLVFIGFLCGPISLGFALWQSLKRVGETRRSSVALKSGLGLGLIEIVVFLLAPVQAIYFNVAGGVLGKIAYDRWLMRPALLHVGAGGKYASNGYLLVFCLVFLFGLTAVLLGLSLTVSAF